MRLRPYISCLDFETIRQWSSDERTHAMWCADLIPYPLEKKSFEAFLSDIAYKSGDRPFVAVTDDEKAVGFFCYSVDPDTNEGMLKFVIVNNELRGRGYGREMLSLAVKYAFDVTKADIVQLNVFSENVRAKKCYLSVGFTERSTLGRAFIFNDESWDRCNMIIKRNQSSE